MDGNTFGGCECSTWCRAEPQNIRDKHHHLCPKHEEVDLKKITVWKVTHGGSSYFDENKEGMLCLLDEMQEGDEYTISRVEMMERDYRALPEFDGF